MDQPQGTQSGVDQLLQTCQGYLQGGDVNKVCEVALGVYSPHKADQMEALPLAFQLKTDPTKAPLLLATLLDTFARCNNSQNSDAPEVGNWHQVLLFTSNTLKFLLEGKWNAIFNSSALGSNSNQHGGRGGVNRANACVADSVVLVSYYNVLLDVSMQAANSNVLPLFVVRALSAVLCCVTKNGFPDAEEIRGFGVWVERQFLNGGLTMQQQMNGNNAPNPQLQQHGTLLLLTLFEEIEHVNQHRSSSDHRKILRAFKEAESGGLRYVFAMCMDLLKIQYRLTGDGGNNSNNGGATANSAVGASNPALMTSLAQVLLACLNYNFYYLTADGDGLGCDLDEQLVSFPTEWREIIVSPENFDLLWKCYYLPLDIFKDVQPLQVGTSSNVTGGGGGGDDDDTSNSFHRIIINAIIQFLGARKSLWLLVQDKKKRMNAVLKHTTNVMVNFVGIGQSQSLLQEFCRLLNRIKPTMRIEEIIDLENYQTWIQALFDFTRKCLDSWRHAEDGFLSLVCMWSKLVRDTTSIRDPTALAKCHILRFSAQLAPLITLALSNMAASCVEDVVGNHVNAEGTTGSVMFGNFEDDDSGDEDSAGLVFNFLSTIYRIEYPGMVVPLIAQCWKPFLERYSLLLGQQTADQDAPCAEMQALEFRLWVLLRLVSACIRSTITPTRHIDKMDETSAELIDYALRALTLVKHNMFYTGVNNDGSSNDNGNDAPPTSTEMVERAFLELFEAIRYSTTESAYNAGQFVGVDHTGGILIDLSSKIPGLEHHTSEQVETELLKLFVERIFDGLTGRYCPPSGKDAGTTPNSQGTDFAAVCGDLGSGGSTKLMDKALDLFSMFSGFTRFSKKLVCLDVVRHALLWPNGVTVSVFVSQAPTAGGGGGESPPQGPDGENTTGEQETRDIQPLVFPFLANPQFSDLVKRFRRTLASLVMSHSDTDLNVTYNKKVLRGGASPVASLNSVERTATIMQQYGGVSRSLNLSPAPQGMYGGGGGGSPQNSGMLYGLSSITPQRGSGEVRNSTGPTSIIPGALNPLRNHLQGLVHRFYLLSQSGQEVLSTQNGMVQVTLFLYEVMGVISAATSNECQVDFLRLHAILIGPNLGIFGNMTSYLGENCSPEAVALDLAILKLLSEITKPSSSLDRPTIDFPPHSPDGLKLFKACAQVITNITTRRIALQPEPVRNTPEAMRSMPDRFEGFDGWYQTASCVARLAAQILTAPWVNLGTFAYFNDTSVRDLIAAVSPFLVTFPLEDLVEVRELGTAAIVFVKTTMDRDINYYLENQLAVNNGYLLHWMKWLEGVLISDETNSSPEFGGVALAVIYSFAYPGLGQDGGGQRGMNDVVALDLGDTNNGSGGDAPARSVFAQFWDAYSNLLRSMVEVLLANAIRDVATCISGAPGHSVHEACKPLLPLLQLHSGRRCVEEVVELKLAKLGANPSVYNKSANEHEMDSIDMMAIASERDQGAGKSKEEILRSAFSDLVEFLEAQYPPTLGQDDEYQDVVPPTSKALGNFVRKFNNLRAVMGDLFL